MKVTFWGTRGSIAAPGRGTAEYGGNTSCVEVRAGDDMFILDCGTGLRELGSRLLSSGDHIKGTILLSHSHWDHIQGFPFFGPLLVGGHEFRIYGPQDHSERLNETLAGQMQYRYFPIGLDQLTAEISYQEMREETAQIGSSMVSSHYLNHTTMAMAYRIESHGRSVVYATDTEPFSQQPRAWASSENRSFLHRSDERLAEFCKDADILIIDSQYTAHEYPSKVGWGHATPDYAVDIAISARVGTLVLFHHDPTRIDTAVSVLERLAQNRAKQEAPDLEVLAAAEGLTLELDDVQSADATPVERVIPQFHARVRIAVVATDDHFMKIAWRALAQDHYEVVAVNDISALDREFRDFLPHLVLIQYNIAAWDDRARNMIKEQTRAQIPVITVIPEGKFEYAQDAFDMGSSDVLVEPFVATQLRSRVDSWLMRAGYAVDRRVRGRTATSDVFAS